MNQIQEFLQSISWLAFQEATGKKIVRFSEGEFLANGILHKLPIVGQYLYVPRGPILSRQEAEERELLTEKMQTLIALAKEQEAQWIRIEPETDTALASIRKAVQRKIVKAPHDTQPREIFRVDISRSEEELLAAMKSKTRYNIRLAEKRGVKVFATREEHYRQVFLDLMRVTAARKEIVPHPRDYYEKFLAALPEAMCQLFVAEHEGQVLAANLLIIFGTTATYLHGGSSDQYRDMMAPYLLQWEQMKFAKAQGCTRYDFGGVKTASNQQGAENQNAWAGITRFKIGFSPQTEPVVFPGTYDIILSPQAYFLYEYLRHLQESLSYIKKFVSR